MEPDPKLIALAIRKVVDTQIGEGDPPETGETFGRLVDEGYSEEEARKMIGHVVVAEVLEVARLGKVYDHKRFLAGLAALPDIPELPE